DGFGAVDAIAGRPDDVLDLGDLPGPIAARLLVIASLSGFITQSRAIGRIAAERVVFLAGRQLLAEADDLHLKARVAASLARRLFGPEVAWCCDGPAARRQLEQLHAGFEIAPDDWPLVIADPSPVARPRLPSLPP